MFSNLAAFFLLVLFGLLAIKSFKILAICWQYRCTGNGAIALIDTLKSLIHCAYLSYYDVTSR